MPRISCVRPCCRTEAPSKHPTRHASSVRNVGSRSRHRSRSSTTRWTEGPETASQTRAERRANRNDRHRGRSVPRGRHQSCHRREPFVAEDAGARLAPRRNDESCLQSRRDSLLGSCAVATILRGARPAVRCRTPRQRARASLGRRRRRRLRALSARNRPSIDGRSHRLPRPLRRRRGKCGPGFSACQSRVASRRKSSVGPACRPRRSGRASRRNLGMIFDSVTSVLRQFAVLDQFDAQAHSKRCVDGERRDGSTADAGLSDQLRSDPPEMTRPFLSSRIEEPDAPAGLRINASQIRALVSVAREARESQVAEYGSAAVLLGDDVIDLEGKFVESLRHSAVFAARTRTASNERGELLADR